MSRRLVILKTVLWALVGSLAVLTVARFTRGLGAVTNLSDAAPWGIWIALDVMAGVALAAGGFVMAGTVYIFGREKYRPLVRPAILTAFVGYVAVAIGLLYDLGLPWHIWHPMIYWQHHSVLFEVAMCVMTYLTVLALEFSPVILEHPSLSHPAFRALLRVLRRLTIPLVIAGIVLSTLHQSSLGSLFLIIPHRLNPLWYSPIIYLLFFVSAVALGMMMVTLESLLSSFFFGHKVRKDLLSGLGAAASVVLTLYVVLRVGDLAVRGVLPSHIDGSWQSILFIAEMLVSAVIPAVLLAIPRVRAKTAGLAVGASLTVIGMVWNRLDVSIVAVSRPEGMRYFPSWMEIMTTLGIVAAAVLTFVFLVERLRVYAERARLAAKTPSYDPASLHMLMPPRIEALRRYSLAFVIAAALVALILPRQAVLGARPAITPTAPVRAVTGVVLTRGAGHVSRLDVVLPGEAVAAKTENGPRRLLMINGNRNDNLVLFDHQAHMKRVTGPDTCGTCHHINMPLDRATPCSDCHRDMYEPTTIFSHEFHVNKLGGNNGCNQCHTDSSTVWTRATATACSHCHKKQIAESPIIKTPDPHWYPAVGYVDAMHGLCIKCHEEAVKKSNGKLSENLPRCDTCHNVDYAARVARLTPKGEEE